MTGRSFAACVLGWSAVWLKLCLKAVSSQGLAGEMLRPAPGAGAATGKARRSPAHVGGKGSAVPAQRMTEAMVRGHGRDAEQAQGTGPQLCWCLQLHWTTEQTWIWAGGGGGGCAF